MTDPQFLYLTAPDVEIAKQICAELVEGRLAACANILAPMQSVYEWDGTIQSREEIAVIVKTTKPKTHAARALIAALHPDTTPCIVALAIDASSSHQPFLDWLAAATTVPTNS